MSKFIEEIEAELKEISPWPWGVNLDVWNEKTLVGKVFNNPNKLKRTINREFIANSPQRIAKLIEMLKKAIELAEFNINTAEGEFEKHKAEEFLEYIKNEKMS